MSQRIYSLNSTLCAYLHKPITHLAVEIFVLLVQPFNKPKNLMWAKLIFPREILEEL
ncbi:MAG: hypothetical protein FWF72_00235 [Paludibacter sp.]|nr:hypothetical protein [Paludibacter sp.]